MSSTTKTPGNPPSGTGSSRETAQWSAALTATLNQPSFVAETQLGAVQYHRCTLDEAKAYKAKNHRVWSDATGRLWRPAGSEDATGAQPGAFYHLYEGVRNAERVLEDARQEAVQEEGVMGGKW
ncbi:hypothetical protein N0V86_002723 [Didymella sp. IMI 355093]|nr:hypothetical protein N0V86_002723 [Didymella sp. IMI 355093]